jgi:hypothetical protein
MSTRKHREERSRHKKVLGRDKPWDVFKYNFAKLFLVDILSRSFIVLAGSLVFTIWFLHYQIYVVKEGIEWKELAIATCPPSFFAYYWIERQRASEILLAIASAIIGFFDNFKITRK